MSKSSTSTGESDPVTDLGLGVLDGAVDGDTLEDRRVKKVFLEDIKRKTHSAENGSSLEAVEVLGDGCYVADP